jgi:hypothetical protein
MPGSFQVTHPGRKSTKDESSHNLNSRDYPNTYNIPKNVTSKEISEEDYLLIQMQKETEGNQKDNKKRRLDDAPNRSSTEEERALNTTSANM